MLIVILLAALNRHHIALSMQVMLLTASRSCGLGIESDGPPTDMGEAAMRIKRLGGVLQYARMVSPPLVVR